MALIIDEIQKAPILLEELKKTIDSQRLIWLREGQERQLMYILSGSNRFELHQGISDSLAGRCRRILAGKERERKIPHPTKAQIFEDIFHGHRTVLLPLPQANCQNAGGLRHERCIL